MRARYSYPWGAEQEGPVKFKPEKIQLRRCTSVSAAHRLFPALLHRFLLVITYFMQVALLHVLNGPRTCQMTTRTSASSRSCSMSRRVRTAVPIQAPCAISRKTRSCRTTMPRWAAFLRCLFLYAAMRLPRYRRSMRCRWECSVCYEVCGVYIARTSQILHHKRDPYALNYHEGQHAFVVVY